MSDNFESSLINLGELSKPATILVEKISDRDWIAVSELGADIRSVTETT